MKNYHIPAPTWLRILRDTWTIFGSAVITYLQALHVPDKTDNVITATIAFIGAMVTIACIVTGQKPPLEDFKPEDSSKLKE